MIAIFSLLLVITISIVITRVATIALTHTGLSRETARFQARSAFTGAGFTTSESESVVNHPVRRKIVVTLMLLGNAGVVTAVSSLILTFVNENDATTLPLKIVLLVLGLVALWTFANSRWVDRHLTRIIDKALKTYTSLDVSDYASLMHLVGDYRLVELAIAEDDWIASKALSDTEIRDEGIVVLGVKRPDGTYLGAPRGSTEVLPGDTLLLYGRVEALERLDRRRADREGHLEHRSAVAEQREVAEKEQRMDTRETDPDGRPGATSR